LSASSVEWSVENGWQDFSLASSITITHTHRVGFSFSSKTPSLSVEWRALFLFWLFVFLFWQVKRSSSKLWVEFLTQTIFCCS
jgi:hypothetical protein